MTQTAETHKALSANANWAAKLKEVLESMERTGTEPGMCEELYACCMLSDSSIFTPPQLLKILLQPALQLLHCQTSHQLQLQVYYDYFHSGSWLIFVPFLAITFVCTACGTVNHLPTSDTHYVVTVGKSVGVFSDL